MLKRNTKQNDLIVGMLSSSSIAISPFLSLACSLCVLFSFLIECSSKYIVLFLCLLSCSGYVKESVWQSSSRYYLRRLEQLTLGYDRRLVQPRVQATVLCLFAYAEGLLINQVGLRYWAFVQTKIQLANGPKAHPPTSVSFCYV